MYNIDGSCVDGTYWKDRKYHYQGGLTVYAQWKPITYTIQYDGNKFTSGSTASSTHTYDEAKKR